MKDLGKRLIGKHILVGLTYLNKDNTIREKFQVHGIAERISEGTIIFVRSDNGEEFSIPFDEENIVQGQPGALYRLHTSGEFVEGVDFISIWEISPPDN